MQSKVYEFFLKNSRDILVCENDKEANICQNVTKFLGFDTFVLPDFRAEYGEDLRSYYDELVGISKELASFHASKNKKKLLISPYKTVKHKLPTKKHLSTKTLNFGDKIDINELKDEILRFGYEIVDIVEMAGEVSFRGDIVDIFPVNSQSAVRILLDFDEIESIKEFDSLTQLSSSDELESVDITPFIAALSKKEYNDTLKKVTNFESSSLLSDMTTLGFWVIDDFIDYLNEYSSIATGAFDESLEVLDEPKIYRDLEVTFTPELLSFHSEKSIKILARNESIFRSYGLTSRENLDLIISPFILNLISTKELIISLNKELPKKRKKRPNIIIDELKQGDYVVHEEYGIGKFIGLEKVKVLGSEREFVTLLYLGGDKLLLPVENLSVIDRYVSSGSVASLDKLGKGSFAKIKERVRVKLFAIANEIIDLAAKRSLVKGKEIYYNDQDYAKFVSSAGFEFTDDQVKAIDEIRDDLKSGKVMERLLSGDVGFGKTEVAMNAIFWAVKCGYQVLFFVPTTLLSSQHFATLNERFKGYDIPVYRCDRFTTTAAKNALKTELSKGTPLVCVGTHALLGLSAKNIGLVIIDEEHKFGVKQKEKLKEISKNSHILSMSATPIPRSLNMALSSLKSYSTLTTAPKEREDVRTSVKEWDEKIVKEAITRELRRGGQIFYVHNHIASMGAARKEILEILPNLRILTLHSKIDEKTTEEELVKFMDGGYDLLLCTSIVESGIHMPNVNTILIDASERFGIADLHQLRGRVGRGSRQGYCYFFVEDKNALSKDAIKRLVALESNSFLGSGSVLAYHDLEIRGGGNLVGEAQSGHIEAIGYSLYLRMLEDAINSLLSKGKEEVAKTLDMKLNVTAFINSDYIREDRLRLDLYRRLSKADEVSKIYEISSEMEDRFGKLDRYTKQFLDLMIVRILALKMGFKLISNFEMNISLVKLNGEKILLKSKSKDDDDILATLLEFLRSKK